MQKEQILLLKELVSKIAGKNTEPIVDIIATNKPVNEFKIAEKLELTINQTRNILYKLSAHSIVSFVRKKDARKGWYIYSWVIDVGKSLSKYVEYKTKEIRNYQNLLNSRKTKGYYVCPSGCIETSEENAMLYDFKCPECGQLLQPESFKAEIEELEAKIAVAKKDISFIDIELTKVNKIKERKEILKMNKEKARKLELRRAKAKKMKRLKLKLMKGKKPVKKVEKKKLKKKVKKKQKKKAVKKKVKKKLVKKKSEKKKR
ncbi:hypothetical protein ACFLZZ_02635 [Nanoarchaeota archaeon]